MAAQSPMTITRAAGAISENLSSFCKCTQSRKQSWRQGKKVTASTSKLVKMAAFCSRSPRNQWRPGLRPFFRYFQIGGILILARLASGDQLAKSPQFILVRPKNPAPLRRRFPAVHPAAISKLQHFRLGCFQFDGQIEIG